MSHVYGTNIYSRYDKNFRCLSRIFHRLRQMNRHSFLYTLTKLRTKIIKSKQDTAKSLA